VLRGNQAIEPKYLFFYTLTDDFIERLNHLQRGTSYPAVRDSDVRAQFIPLAPLPEQRRIVARIEELFSQLDAAEEGLRRVQRNLKRYRAAVLKAAVEGRLVPRRGVAPLRPDETGEALLQRILAERRRKWEEQEWAKLVEKAKKKAAQARRKAQGRPARLTDIPPEEWQAIPEAEYRRYLPKDDRWKQRYKEPAPPDTANLPPLPEGWAWATVGMVTLNHDDRRIPVKAADRAQMQGPYPYYGASGIIDYVNGYLFDGTYLLVAEDGANLLSRTLPVAFQAHGRFWVNNHAHVLSTLAECPLGYLEAFFNAIDLSPYVSGTAQPKLTQKKLNSIPVPLPPLAEQRRIVAEVERRLSVVREAEKAVEANLKRIARLRQTILKRAFEGRLVA